MAWISAVFFCLGAADTLLGDRLGLGSAFRQGFAAVVDLLLLMTGFMALAPWLGTHLAPIITPVFSAVGCDPSLFASLFLSCDAGGAVLAAQILAVADDDLAAKLDAAREKMARQIAEKEAKLQAELD